MKKDLEWKKFPWISFFVPIFLWVGFAGFLLYYQLNGGYTGTGLLFPFSVIYPNPFLVAGVLSALAFLIVGVLSMRYCEKMSFWGLMLVCVLLVALGNLSQGNFDIAFLQPFYLKGRQYYTDALAITDGGVWLRDFSKNLESFQLHTRTHPPFITLLHYWILKVSNLETLSVVFCLISALTFPLFYGILKNLNVESHRAKLLTLLLAVVPSINIYLFVSIDGMVLTSTLVFLLGVSRVFLRKEFDVWSFLLIVLGLILTNLITFSGLFLFAFLGCISLYFLSKGNWGFTWLSAMVTLLFVLFFALVYVITGYSQLEVFLLASQSENPNGFRLLHQPYIYFMTRLEGVSEILFFLSFGFLALLFSKREGTEMLEDKNNNILFFSAVASLSAMLLTGAYGTGETARACLFMVPYFLILLKSVKESHFRMLYYLCLLQTFGMQMIGNYYW